MVWAAAKRGGGLVKIWYNENWEPVRLDIDPARVVRSAITKVDHEDPTDADMLEPHEMGEGAEDEDMDV